MSSKEVYKRKFEDMLDVEKKVRDFYKYYIDNIKDPYILEKLQEIFQDEEKHVKIVQGFIDKLSAI